MEPTRLRPHPHPHRHQNSGMVVSLGPVLSRMLAISHVGRRTPDIWPE